MEIGLGQMDMSPDEFDGITIAEFYSKQKGYLEAVKQKDRNDWQRTIALINIQLPAGKKIDIDRIFNPKPLKVMSKKEFETMVKKLERYHVTGKSQLPI